MGAGDIRDLCVCIEQLSEHDTYQLLDLARLGVRVMRRTSCATERGVIASAVEALLGEDARNQSVVWRRRAAAQAVHVLKQYLTFLDEQKGV